MRLISARIPKTRHCLLRCSRWCNAKLLAAKTFPELDFDFTFHDLKAKEISDLEGTLEEKQAISGHKNTAQTATYDRKTKIVPVVGGQKK